MSPRFGWALIKDRTVAAALDHYLFLHGQGPGVEAQYRAARILDAIRRSYGRADGFFEASKVRGCALSVHFAASCTLSRSP